MVVDKNAAASRRRVDRSFIRILLR